MSASSVRLAERAGLAAEGAVLRQIYPQDHVVGQGVREQALLKVVQETGRAVLALQDRKAVVEGLLRVRQAVARVVRRVNEHVVRGEQRQVLARPGLVVGHLQLALLGAARLLVRLGRRGHLALVHHDGQVVGEAVAHLADAFGPLRDVAYEQVEHGARRDLRVDAADLVKAAGRVEHEAAWHLVAREALEKGGLVAATESSVGCPSPMCVRVHQQGVRVSACAGLSEHNPWVREPTSHVVYTQPKPEQHSASAASSSRPARREPLSRGRTRPWRQRCSAHEISIARAGTSYCSLPVRPLMMRPSLPHRPVLVKRLPLWAWQLCVR